MSVFYRYIRTPAGSACFRVQVATERMRIDAAGMVGIGGASQTTTVSCSTCFPPVVFDRARARKLADAAAPMTVEPQSCSAEDVAAAVVEWCEREILLCGFDDEKMERVGATHDAVKKVLAANSSRARMEADAGDIIRAMRIKEGYERKS